jgi:hypothetical protein
VEFRLAYSLEKRGRALAQVALAEDALGLWVEAEEALEEVLSRGDDAWVEKRREQLGGELATLRTHLADLELEVVPPTAEVWVNGAPSQRRAQSGTFRLAAGRALVEVKAAGFETARRVLETPAGARLREKIVLEAAPVPPAIGPETTSPGAVLDARSTPPVAPLPGSTRSSLTSIVALSALGVAGAAFVAGTVGAVERVVSLNEYNDDSRCDYGGVARSVRCAGTAADVDRFTTVMTVGYVTAAVAALTGGVLAFAFPRKVRVDVAEAGRGGWALWARGEF